jgi:hypothetical protein
MYVSFNTSNEAKNHASLRVHIRISLKKNGDDVQQIRANKCSKLPSLRGTKQSRTMWDLACLGLLRTSQ